MSFGREYLIPKPFDPRVLIWEAPAVAKAAMDTGVARKPITDWDAYRESLERMLGPSRKVMHFVDAQGARRRPPAGSCSRKASTTPSSARPATSSTRRSPMPVLLGSESEIRAQREAASASSRSTSRS